MQTPAYAFFDVDDTILKTKSMFSFFEYWCKSCKNDIDTLASFNKHFDEARSNGASRELMNRDYYRFYAGTAPKEVEKAGKLWANSVIENDLIFIETTSLMKELSDRGICPVFVSGSFSAVLQPIANHLGVTYILSTQMKIRSDGRYSGDISDPQTIGVGKAVAIKQFLTRYGSAAAACWALGDDVSDVPMLECVGHPVAVGSNPKLLELARERCWDILSLRE
ncbi:MULTISPECIES: HAD family hydrolase [unclassified Aureimonas]|uniref:HAD family hydrolase n=1 Tax=unclassified Aureimonas TaxID=2615206 RepID=UPI0009E7248C|nr:MULTISPECIES: HAD-IB family hydrolase [unclassified Aureimonas]